MTMRLNEAAGLLGSSARKLDCATVAVFESTPATLYSMPEASFSVHHVDCQEPSISRVKSSARALDLKITMS